MTPKTRGVRQGRIGGPIVAAVVSLSLLGFSGVAAAASNVPTPAPTPDAEPGVVGLVGEGESADGSTLDLTTQLQQSGEASSDDNADAPTNVPLSPSLTELEQIQDAGVTPQAVGDITPLAMPTGRNYLVWEVKDTNGAHVGGMTVAVEGPRSSGYWTVSWGGPYNVTDCTSDPCGANSMDQDPRPGYFAVQQLISVNDSGVKATTNVSSSNRYRIKPVGSGPTHKWVTPEQGAIEIPQYSQNYPNSPLNWPNNGPWDFTSGSGAGHGSLTVAPIGTDSTSFCQASVAANQYFTLQRSGTGERTTSIQIATHNEDETAINTGKSTLSNSTVTLPSGQTANALGVTNEGVFYFTSQNAQTRPVTVYRFQAEVDKIPVAVHTIDLLSPTTGTIVAGDATVFDGREEFYFAYTSAGPNSSVARFHLYRYSAGSGSRTGEVAHVDIPIPAGSDFDVTKGLNGDFTFDSQNNIQFVISNWGGTSGGGHTLSGVVPVASFQGLPGRTNLADVPTIQGSANAGKFTSTSTDGINGLTFTSRGNAIIQRGSINSFADPTTMATTGTSQDLGGTLVDLASCGSPATITVLKNVEGARVADTDQFTLSASRSSGSETFPFDPVTTQGTATGVQSQQLGPFVLLLDGTFTASETFSGTPDNWNSYLKTYQCYETDSDGNRLTNGDGTPVEPFTSGDGHTLSFALSGTGRPPAVHDGAHLVCMFTNRGSPPATVTVHKDVLPDGGGSGAAIPREGWTVGMLATKTGDSDITVTKNNGEGVPLTQQQTNAQGDASWSIEFAPGTTNPAASVKVSEVMQDDFSFVSGTCQNRKADGDTTTYTFDSTTAVAGLDIPDVAPGDTVTCNFLNGKVPTLELCKAVAPITGGVGPTAAPTDWLLAADGQSPTNEDSSFEGAQCGSPRQVAPGDYKLSEVVNPDGNVTQANAYNVAAGWSCVRREVGSDVEGDPEPLGDDATVTVYGPDDAPHNQDAAVRCTITNQAAELSLLKRVEGYSETTDADFLVSVTPLSDTDEDVDLPALKDGRGINAVRDFNTVTVKPDTEYQLTETSAKWGTTENSVPYLVRALEKYQVDAPGCPATPTEVSIANAACWQTVAAGTDGTYTVTAGAIGGREFYRFANVAPTPAPLPAAGGTAATWFLVAGAAALAVAGSAGLIHMRRRAE